jgi:hypothetical protein
VTADRTFNRSFYRFNRVSAVGADPELLFTSLEQPFVFYIGKQKLVAGFMGLFNFAGLGEKECNLREPSFLAVSANSGYMEVHSSCSPSAAISRCSAVDFFRSPTSQN